MKPGLQEDKLHALQASNKANDSKRKDEQASWVAESQHATQELNSLKRETAVQQDQLDGLSKTIEEATLLLEQRRSHEADLKQQRAGRTELFAKKLELETEIVAHQTSIAMREQSSNKVIEKEMEIAQLKDANDKADIEKLTADLCDKKKKLEELDSLISETSLPEAKFLLPCTLDEQQEKLDKKQREVDDKQGKIQEQEVKLQELLQMLSEQMEKTEKECQEVQNLLTDETVALQEDLEKHSVFVDSVILKDDAEFRALLRQSALMRYGAKILLNTEKKESKVAKAEAAFQASNRSEN